MWLAKPFCDPSQDIWYRIVIQSNIHRCSVVTLLSITLHLNPTWKSWKAYSIVHVAMPSGCCSDILKLSILTFTAISVGSVMVAFLLQEDSYCLIISFTDVTLPFTVATKLRMWCFVGKSWGCHVTVQDWLAESNDSSKLFGGKWA